MSSCLYITHTHTWTRNVVLQLRPKWVSYIEDGTNWQRTVSNVIHSEKMSCILIQNWSKFIPRGPIDNRLTWTQVMA